MRGNAVQKSLVDLWYGDFWARQAELSGNAAGNGSILDLESFIGSFEQVSCQLVRVTNVTNVKTCQVTAGRLGKYEAAPLSR
jgi:hypothetical protein